VQVINSFIASIMLSLSSWSGEREEGQTLVEYALIIALVSIALVGGLTLLAGGIGTTFSTIIAAL
jgi:Flp pilus assembly pilin Flp